MLVSPLPRQGYVPLGGECLTPSLQELLWCRGTRLTLYKTQLFCMRRPWFEGKQQLHLMYLYLRGISGKQTQTESSMHRRPWCPATYRSIRTFMSKTKASKWIHGEATFKHKTLNCSFRRIKIFYIPVQIVQCIFSLGEKVYVRNKWYK